MTEEEKIKNRLIELTRDLVLIPTTEFHPEDMERGMEFIKNHLEETRGISVKIHQSHGVPSLVALPDNHSEPEILLCAHLDVIPMPRDTHYRSTIENGRIYGPGAGDMKGSLAILLEVFRDIHFRLPGASLGLVVTSDEERGGKHGIEYLFQEAGLRCKNAIIPDSGSLNQVTVQEKGTVHLKVSCYGPSGHACHPWLVDNPLERLIDRLSEIKSFFEDMEKREDCWHPTFTITIVRTPNEAANRIPAHAEATCDVRFTPPFTTEKMLDIIREKLDEDMEVEVLISAEVSHYNPDPLFLEITEEITGKPAVRYQAHGGSDARFLCTLGIPAIMSRPEVGSTHSEKEWVNIDSMVKLYKIYEKYLEKKLSKTVH